MIVCHCNVLTRARLEAAVDELLAADPYRVLTPGLVYMTLGKKGKCCGCFPNAVAIITARADLVRARVEAAAAGLPPPAEAEDADEPAGRAA